MQRQIKKGTHLGGVACRRELALLRPPEGHSDDRWPLAFTVPRNNLVSIIIQAVVS